MGNIKLSSDVIRALRKLGFSNVVSITLLSPSELAKLVGISEDMAEELIRLARSKLPVREVREYERASERLSLGCKALDEMLGGGVETGAITELVGEFGTGKTQICHQLCVTVQLPPEKGGLSARAVYIDTEGTFRPERIVQISSRFGLDPASVLRNVYYARVRSLAEQVVCLAELEDLIDEGAKLVVVDSVIAHFKGTYEGPDFFTRVHELALYLSELRDLALKRDVVVVVTNRITSIPVNGGRIKVSGDPFISMFVDYRILLYKVRENIRRAVLVFGRGFSRASTLFKISEDGIIDLS